jgi:cytolysin (calcineurin-like family phosphatase)
MQQPVGAFKRSIVPAAVVGLLLLAGLSAWALSTQGGDAAHSPIMGVAGDGPFAARASAPAVVPFAPIEVGRTVASRHAIATTLPSVPSYVVVTSDPQYPWGPGPDVAANSRQLIAEQYASINRFAAGKNVRATFVNGDLTAFGHTWQIAYMQGALKTLTTPVYLGLGNHDYQNNIDDCWENRCARESVWWFADHMSKMPLDAFDIRFRHNWEFAWPFIGRDEAYGSLAWSKTFDDIVFIQLNNYPEYEKTIPHFNYARWTHETVTIKSALPWLDKQMSSARRQGKAIVLMMHIPQGGEEFQRLVDRYEVSAIFAGHFHQFAGKFGAMGMTRVPVYLSGSADQRTYLALEWEGPTSGDLTIALARNNATPQAIDTIALKKPFKHLPPRTYPFDVKVYNKGGYEASYGLTYRVGGQQQVQKAYLLLAQGHTFKVPGDATEVRLEAWTNTGVLWNQWNRFIDMGLADEYACVETWGTTWHPGWGYCDG